MIRSRLFRVILGAGLAALGSCAGDTGMRNQARSSGTTMVRAESLSTADLEGEWTGTLDQFSHEIEGTFPVQMTIVGTTGNEFTGTMDWPTFNGCKTEIRGMFDGSVIRWTETAYLVGDDVVLNGLYVARFETKSKITGEWMDPKHTIFPKGPKYGVIGATIVLTKN